MHESFLEALRQHLLLPTAFRKYLGDFQRAFKGHWQDTSDLNAKVGRTLTEGSALGWRSGGYSILNAAEVGNRRTAHRKEAVALPSTPPIHVRMIAHDLRAPLASATLSLQVARDSRTPPEKLEKALDLAEKSLEALGALIDSIVGPAADTRQGISLDLRKNRPSELIANAVDQVSPLAAQRNLHLSADEPASLPALGCDGMQITRVLVNLLSNAIKHTPAGGRITVDAGKRNNDGHPAVVFSVADNGPGISRELAGRIFDVGVSFAKDGNPSTGLGLAVCREIVEAHHGRIWVETDRSDGATFSFAIPLNPVPLSYN